MKVLHSDESHYHHTLYSIFLVGPTPRNGAVPSWRPQALEILEKLGFDGLVYVPERKDWKSQFDYMDQVEWEYAGISAATFIVAWVPRNLENMLGLTTNVEFGYWLATTPAKLIYGRPFAAQHTRYLDWLYNKVTNQAPFDNLQSLLQSTIQRLNAIR